MLKRASTTLKTKMFTTLCRSVRTIEFSIFRSSKGNKNEYICIRLLRKFWLVRINFLRLYTIHLCALCLFYKNFGICHLRKDSLYILWPRNCLIPSVQTILSWKKKVRICWWKCGIKCTWNAKLHKTAKV